MAKKPEQVGDRRNSDSTVSFSVPITTAEWDFLARYFSAPLMPHEARALLYHLVGLVEVTGATLLTEEALSQPHVKVSVEVHDVA